MKYTELKIVRPDLATKFVALAVAANKTSGKEVISLFVCDMKCFYKQDLRAMNRMIDFVAREVALKNPDFKIITDYTIEFRCLE